MVEAGSLSENIPGTSIDAAAATAGQLRQAIASGQLTAADLTAFYLARIERLNPDLRAVITVSESAAADARASDDARAVRAAGAAGQAAAGGQAQSANAQSANAVQSANGARPLEGIPVLIKDNISVRGMPATAGSPALAGAEQGDAWLVTRLREAGAVILGKANLSEWANFRSLHSTSGWSTLGGQAAN